MTPSHGVADITLTVPLLALAKGAATGYWLTTAEPPTVLPAHKKPA